MNMLQQLIPALRMTVLLTVLTGLIYPGVVTGLCQLFFQEKANGSLIARKGQILGSGAHRAKFHPPRIFPSASFGGGNDGYDATASSGSNFGPTNQKLYDRVKAAADQFRKDNPDYTGPIPADALTASGSGLDPAHQRRQCRGATNARCARSASKQAGCGQADRFGNRVTGSWAYR